VVEVHGEPANVDWSQYAPVYPSSGDLSRDCLLSGHDVFTNLRFSTPIYFKLHVPIKNQPKVYDWTDSPTEDYWVGWDGVSVFVLWECDPDAIHPPGAGGHIAFEVLKEAAEKAGMGLVVQACSPGCSNMFGHTDIRIVQLPESTGVECFGIEDYVAVAVLSVDGEPLDVLTELVEKLATPGRMFARMKNRARRVMDLEAEARTMVAELLARDYARLDHRSKGVVRRTFQSMQALPAVLGGKGHRRVAKHTIASLWLALAGLETLRRDWEMARLQFQDGADKRGLNLFYDIDRKNDDNYVEGIKLDFIRSAIEQQSSRLDNHMVAMVTAVGGVAALVGALAGGALGGG
jgi:hypothetical protein